MKGFILTLLLFCPRLLSAQVNNPADTTTQPVPVIQSYPDKWFAEDKAKHFLMSAVISGAVSIESRYRSDLCQTEAFAWGLTLSLSAGLIKEFRDLSGPSGHFCWKDLVWDFIGSCAGILLLGGW